MINSLRNKKAQLTIFIIVAIVIIVSLILFFLFRGSLSATNVPVEIEPVYNYYLGCIDEGVGLGGVIMGEQAGYIEPPEFEPGSVYMPFSNQLNFFGIGVPYWHYVSGNNVVKEQMPTKKEMEEQLSNFLEEVLVYCDFSNFVEKGFEIRIGKEVEVDTEINKNNVEVRVNQNLEIKYGDSSWTNKVHSQEVSSNLGNFYELSKDIFSDFKDTMFLEEYGIDILRLYAPVDGVETGCSPLIWSVGEVRENLTRALEANTGFIKLEGDYYDLSKEEHKYFVHSLKNDVDARINFLYLREWPMKMEVWPSEGGLMRADSVGLQEGLGMLGFCYTPYHFVYDFAYPVMIQMFYNDEMFQFPVVVYINKNQPREPVNGTGLNLVPELCEYRNTEMRVFTYDREFNPIEADISFKCFDTSCNIGRTRLSNGGAILIDDFPQCINGYVVAKAEGFEIGKYVISSVNENDISLVLDRKYELTLEIRKGGSLVSGEDYAVITFKKDGVSRTYSYPQQKKIELSEGQYEIKAYIYSDTNLRLEGKKGMKCVDIPKSGFFGVFGFTEEKCFDLDIPNQEIEFAVSGGGTQNHYITETELEDSNKIIIDSQNFESVSKIENLQMNYNQIEVSRLNVRFE